MSANNWPDYLGPKLNGPSPINDRVDDLLNIIDEETEYNNSVLAKFRENFDKNPRHALEWERRCFCSRSQPR